MNLGKSRSRYERWQFEKLYGDNQSENEMKVQNLTPRSVSAKNNGSRRVIEKPPIPHRNSNVNTTIRNKSESTDRDLCYFFFEDEILLQGAKFVINCSNKGLKVCRL